MNNPFETVKKQIEQAAKELDLKPETVEVLKKPYRVLTVNFPVIMDDGSKKVFTGYRSQHNNALGPHKGGIRFHPEVNEDEVKALSAWMSIKCSVANIPLGGGKGGVIVNPKELSQSELEKVSRGYMRAIADYVGPEKDIPAPDVYTNAQVMAWMLDEYEKVTGTKAPGVITGKPLELGGSKGRNQATAMGGVFILEEAVKEMNFTGKKVAIQGFGNAGNIAASLLHERGFKIIAVTDSSGMAYDENGLDVPKLLEHKSSTGSVKGFATDRDVNELWSLEVDILIPAALENQITEDNAAQIKAKIVLELANGPTTLEADEILHKNGVFLIPDVMANSGGVTVSYFEWYQNMHNESWSEEEVLKKLEDKMHSAFHEAYKLHKPERNFRVTTFLSGVRRIADAIEAK